MTPRRESPMEGSMLFHQIKLMGWQSHYYIQPAWHQWWISSILGAPELVIPGIGSLKVIAWAKVDADKG